MLNMAEFSAAANTLALVAIAGQSCHFLYKFLSRIPKASNDIQHHILLLRCLRSTFANIETLSQDIELDRITVLHFHTRVQECMDDLQTMQLRLSQVSDHHDADQKKKAISLITHLQIMPYLLYLVLPFLVVRSANELVLAIIYGFETNTEPQVGQVVESALLSLPSVFVFIKLVLIQYRKDWEPGFRHGPATEIGSDGGSPSLQDKGIKEPAVHDVWWYPMYGGGWRSWCFTPIINTTIS